MAFVPLFTDVRLTMNLTPDVTDAGLAAYGLPPGLNCSLLTIKATTADLLTPVPVFVLQLAVRDPRATTPDEKWVAEFSNVASPADWQRLPVGLPVNPTSADQMCLTDTIVLVCESPAAANYIMAAIQEDLQRTVDWHKQASTFPPATTTFTTTAEIN